MKIEPIKIKNLIITLLVLVVSLQSIQVHSLVLSAEQSGHASGLLVHQHSTQHIQHSSHTDSSSAINSLSQDASTDNIEHESPCHPAHVLFPFNLNLIENSHFKAVRKASSLATALSIIASLDTPPPKTSA
ncbi:hypothetical protein A9R01_11255 ['Osedax' symbiont bacterium Rs2_46_30_T18]|nr:hypothetical protein A9R01_11255 ['Osedax' symbiont bacterium Rs2_46_30_T18]